MSKVLLINGSPHEKGCNYTALSEIADTWAENEVESELLYLGTKPMAGCIALRSLAQNMAWLLKNMHAGKGQGIQPPVYEERIDTDFI